MVVSRPGQKWGVQDRLPAFGTLEDHASSVTRDGCWSRERATGGSSFVGTGTRLRTSSSGGQRLPESPGVPKTKRVPRDKTLRVRGRGWRKNAKAWGRGGTVQFSSPPSSIDWGGGFGLHLNLDQPALGLFLSPTEARKFAAELVRRADDLEARRRG